MAPRNKNAALAIKRQVAIKRYHKQHFIIRMLKRYLTVEMFKYFLMDVNALPIVSVFILLCEAFLNLCIINFFSYTEIDWKAYMQECEGFLNGTTNYALLKGDTGPLVYPAAFVYIFSALYYITSQGQNIRLAQYIFGIIFLLNMWLVLRIYKKSGKVPPYALLISTFTSYRIHSIFVLRLFNDPIAMLFLYAALNLFLDNHWTWGSICFSLGVGCKMNVLLYAPVILLFYLMNLGLFKTIKQLSVCGIVQLLLGLPFLLTYPWEYIKASFNMGRVFDHTWTVNYRFLPKRHFENPSFHLALLTIHLVMLFAFMRPSAVFFKNYARLRFVESYMQPQLDQQNKKNKKKKSKSKKLANTEKKQNPEEQLTPEQKSFMRKFTRDLPKLLGNKSPIKKEQTETTNNDQSEAVSVNFDQCTQLALLPIFMCNFIGIVFARSLHYQFYVWYFHTLPYLTWSTNYSIGVRVLLMLFIELCWNCYPSTFFSSIALHICHLMILFGVGINMIRIVGQSNDAVKQAYNVANQTYNDGSQTDDLSELEQ